MKELENVKILFYNDYWDGPIDGLCEYENKIYRYKMIDNGLYNEEIDNWSPRIYNVIEIEPWQLAYELYWHSLFCTNIVAYTEFDKMLINPRFEIKNKDFYKKQKNEYKEIDYSNNAIIGIFKN
jgi:hypothetical protein